MRKFVLIAAMVLVSATAEAGQSRSLTMASTDQPATSTQPAKTADAADPAARGNSEIRRAPRRRRHHDDRGVAEGRCRQRAFPDRQGRQAEAQEVLDRSAHHRRAASPRHLLVSDT